MRITGRIGRKLGVSAAALSVSLLAASAGFADDKATATDPADAVKTVSPIKHVIIMIGENRGTDHTFGVYKPKGKGQTCLLYTSPSPRDRQKSRMPSSA